METYLQTCCETYEWMGCVVVGADGLLLASAGHGLDDACTALLPGWLAAGDGIAEQGDLEGMTCCCMMPKNKTAMILAWSMENPAGEKLYFAVRTRHIPRQVMSVLAAVGHGVQGFLYPEQNQG